MKATLEAINQMQADGVICHYAIGGAVGAVQYSEPATTLEMEVLVKLPFDPGCPSVSLTALHNYLLAHGHKTDGECFEPGRLTGAVSCGEQRYRLAALRFSEKVEILEKLRDREKAIAPSRLTRKTEKRDNNPPQQNAD